MILKGSQRGGPRQLATHLLNNSLNPAEDGNDHVSVHELRGFIADDLHGAMMEAHAVSKGTRCTQPVFSLSLNPPKDAEVSIDLLVGAADRAEELLGLKDQPRAIVIHEKEGRRHAHVVWSRIDAEAMKAINLPFFKTRLAGLSKELYLENGWELPQGHRENGWKNPLNFTLAEWQQAKRLGLDPRETKQVFRTAWLQSDNFSSFRAALEDHGYFLARGDRRGFVALDIQGEVFPVARWAGEKTKTVEARLGDPAKLRSVEEVRKDIASRTANRLGERLQEDRKRREAELKPLVEERAALAAAHRGERQRLQDGQKERWEMEARLRAGRFRRGLPALVDFLTGRSAEIKRKNEFEAYVAHLRDRVHREALFMAQMKERKALQQRIEAVRGRHKRERQATVRHVASILKMEPQDMRAVRSGLTPGREKGPAP